MNLPEPDDYEIKREILRLLDARYLWHRCWFLHSRAKIPWKAMRVLPDRRDFAWHLPVFPLSESTCRRQGRRGQVLAVLQCWPLRYFLSLRALKALSDLGIDPCHPEAVQQTRRLMGSYLETKRLPHGLGRITFFEILNLLDDLETDECKQSCGKSGQ